MKFKPPGELEFKEHTSSFYGVCHHDAKEIEASWKNLCTTYSMEDVLGTPKQKNDTEKIDEKCSEE